jgi:hypothetical protein
MLRLLVLTSVALVQMLLCRTECRAQYFIQPVPSQASQSLARPGVAPAHEKQSWTWVHVGVAVQVAGNLVDCASSWKQPEGNSLLAQSSGAYQGKFYTGALASKSAVSAGLVAASYAIGKKWPKARKFVGIFNVGVGGAFAAAGVSNLVRNPAFH